MRYNSIHNYYLIGLILALSVTVYGLIILNDSTKIHYLIRLFCLLLSIFIISGYYSKYKYLKSRYVIVEDSMILLHLNGETYQISKPDISSIFIMNHRNYLKIHNVIHIYLKNGEYFYLTNDIDKFNELKIHLTDRFSDKVFIGKKTCTEHFVVNEENLYRLFFGNQKKN